MIYHAAGVHTWGRDKTFQVCRKCAHPRMAKTDRKWLAAGSPSHETLKSIVLNERLLADIKQTNAFTHTGRLESCHSLLQNTAQSVNIFPTQECVHGHHWQFSITMRMLIGNKRQFKNRHPPAAVWELKDTNMYARNPKKNGSANLSWKRRPVTI